MTAAKSNRNQQCKKWEKERRDRLNESFNSLAKLLPCYEPSSNISKIDILIKSAEYISKLKAKTCDNSDKVKNDEIKELNVRIVYLTTRNEQLANLLKDANISIPSECGGQISDKTKKWSGKITPQKADEINKSKIEKENKSAVSNKKKPNVTGRVKSIKLEEKKKKVKRKSNNAKISTANTSVTSISPISRACSTLTITNVQPVQPYYIIANNIASTITTQATTVKNVITTPILSTTNQPNKTFLLPVVQPNTLLNQSLFINPTPSNTVYLVKKADQSLSTPTSVKTNTKLGGKQKKLALLRPKRRLGNKIQLPSTKFDSLVLWSSSPQVTVKKRTKVKANNKRKITKPVNENKNDNTDNSNAKSIKKPKLSEDIDADNQDNSKKQSSDYSINAICKENESPTSKDIEKVINEVVEKANPLDKDLKQIDQVQSNQTPVVSTKTKEQSDITKELHKQIITKDNSVNISNQEVVQSLPQNGDVNMQTMQNTNQMLHSNHHTQQDLHHLHSELSNDIFASLQVQGSQNPESTSPTAAFLNAFPLVSSFTGVKVTEVLEEETTDSPHGTPTLLQIGNMEATQKLQTPADNLTPSIINLDNFSFFNNNLYNNFDNMITSMATTATTANTIVTTVSKSSKIVTSKIDKVMYDNTQCTNMIPPVSNNDAKHYRNSVKKQHVKTSSSVPNVYNSVASVATTIAQPFYDNSQGNSSRAVVSSGINFNSTTNRYNEYNTFNPFELPKTTQSFVKSYNESSYVNNNCNYSYQSSDYNYQIGKNNYYDGNNCNFYNNTNSNTVNNNTNNNLVAQNSSGGSNNAKFNKKSKEVPSKSMVNWMAPDFSTSAAKVTSYSDIGQNNYLNTNALYPNDYQNTVQSIPDHQSHQEHQFAWSPTKLPQLLDTSQYLTPSTLPTLVGDLALGIGSYSGTTQTPQKAKHTKKQTQYEPGNILSVSQLVDHTHHNKDNSVATARITNRRNSGNGGNNRTKTSAAAKSVANKRHKDKEKTPKVTNYSAESLIAAKQQNYPKTIPTYLPDNILPYFPHNIDENFSQNNQTYHQNNTFPTNYNNSFIPPSTSTTYLPASNFMPDMFENNPMENIFSHVNPTKNANLAGNTHNNKKSPAKNTITNSNITNIGNVPNVGNVNLPPVVANVATTSKSKSKKKETFVDLSFLSMPSINSPLLQEDFLPNFLPPPPNSNQLYSSCKNPVPVAPGVPGIPTDNTIRSRAIQHPEISPAPGSLTNFNLCTIFPEINRTASVVPDVFRNYSNNSGQKSSNYLPNLE